MDEGRRPVAVIAGASGFIGRAVAHAFASEGYELRLIGREAAIRWDDAEALRRAVEGADVVVNLAGKSVNCRYNDRNRDEIRNSRLRTTRALRTAIARADDPPGVWLNSSTATIYRHSTDRENTESTGDIGTGFSVDVATAWEEELFAGALPRTRRVALRTAIVIGDGPAARMLLGVARWGLGGTQFDGWCPPHRRYRGIGPRPTGSDRAPWYRTHGRQKFSWVHIDDVVAAIRFIRDDDRLSGPINVVAPARHRQPHAHAHPPTHRRHAGGDPDDAVDARDRHVGVADRIRAHPQEPLGLARDLDARGVHVRPHRPRGVAVGGVEPRQPEHARCVRPRDLSLGLLYLSQNDRFRLFHEKE